MLDRIRALAAMHQLREFTVAQVAERAGLLPNTTKQIIHRETKRGLVERVGMERRLRGSSGGAPQARYLLLFPDKIRSALDAMHIPQDDDVFRQTAVLQTELRQKASEVAPVRPPGPPDGIPVSLLIAEDKLSNGLAQAAAAITNAADPAARRVTEEDFEDLLQSIDADLRAARREIAQPLPRIDAARRTLDDIKKIVRPAEHQLAVINPPTSTSFSVRAEIGCQFGAMHAAAVAAQTDHSWAGSVGLAWAAQLCSLLVDRLEESSDNAGRVGVELVQRFFDVAGTSSNPGVFLFEEIAQPRAAAGLLYDALMATGAEVVRPVSYRGGKLAGHVVFLSEDQSASDRAKLVQEAQHGTRVWLVDASEHHALANFAISEPGISYVTLKGRTRGLGAARVFEVARDIRAGSSSALVGPLNPLLLSDDCNWEPYVGNWKQSW